MATYYPNSSNQREGEVTPTLYLRDSETETEASYPEAPVLPGNMMMMMYLNYPSSSGSYTDTLAANSQPQQNCVGLSSVGALELIRSPHSQQGILSSLVGSHSGDQAYGGVWRDGRNEMLFMQPTGGGLTTMQAIGATDDDLGCRSSSVNEDPRMSLQTRLGILQGGQNLQGGQGLSLSLSTQIPSAIPAPSFQFLHPNPGISSFLSPHPTISGEGGSGTGSCRDDESSQCKQSRNADYLSPGFPGGNQDAIKREALNNLQCSVRPKQMHSDPSPYGLASAIPNSKYLKAAQQLLDEVVNVQKALKRYESDKHQGFQGFASKGFKDTDGRSKDGAALPPATGVPSDPQEITTNSMGELSPAERQDLQNKMTKLLSMLDEVDRRYRQYSHQMQIVVSSFDVIAGCGAAKPYTALALETISRHFRCLHDAINGQIKATRRSLGEQDTAGNSTGSGISRLRFVDQQLRQQRALQQLGMMQQHAWRPQRGLPESSVSILRAWLFEHFLHPYPKDSDKIMLARQTGLTRGQVSNWFINARVRLWKPMVEEMYKEEFGDTEMDSNSSSENTPNAANDDIKASKDWREESQKNIQSANIDKDHTSQFNESKSNLIPDVEMSGPTAGDCFQNGAHGEDDTVYYEGMKLRVDQRSNMDESSLLQGPLVQSDGSGSGRFMVANTAYQMAELGRLGSGSGVSLTLGLQHCDGGGIPMSSDTHHNFDTMRGDEMYNAVASLGPETADYDYTDPGNRRHSHRFGSSHLLHDFVA